MFSLILTNLLSSLLTTQGTKWLTINTYVIFLVIYFDKFFSVTSFKKEISPTNNSISDPLLYNCNELGHIMTQWQKPKKAQSEVKVFALSGADISSSDDLIWDTCFINDVPLIAIIDTWVTYSFISLDCVQRLDLEVSSLSGIMVIDTPASGSIVHYIYLI